MAIIVRRADGVDVGHKKVTVRRADGVDVGHKKADGRRTDGSDLRIFNSEYILVNQDGASQYAGGFNRYVKNTNQAEGNAWMEASESTNGYVYVRVDAYNNTNLQIFGGDQTVGYNQAIITTSAYVPTSGFSTMAVTYFTTGDGQSQSMRVGVKNAVGPSGLLSYDTTITGVIQVGVGKAPSGTAVYFDISGITFDGCVFLGMWNQGGVTYAGRNTTIRIQDIRFT
ncbi:MAG: hypothetical protein ACK5L3_12215 [Oscillospiraceae bacterium]